MFPISFQTTTDDHVIPNFPRSMSAHPATGRCQTPFAFPFTPLGLSLFDTDPSRILTMLHHQTLLAEEALRYRGLLFSSPKDPLRFSSISDILSSSKDQDNKRSIMYKTQNNNNNNNNNNTIISRFMSTPTTTFNNHHHHHQQHHHHSQQQQQQLRQTASASPQYYKDSILEELKKRSEETVQREEEAEMELTLNGSATSVLPVSSKDTSTFNTFFRRNVGGGSCSSLIETASLRYAASTETSSSKEKSSSSSTSSTPPPLNKSTMSSSTTVDSLLFTEPIEEETRCVVCNAQFPNVWLLEQHAALQHPNSGGPEDKPFICEQCGQSYRYRSAYAKHKEQNHRARLPADKLFTCDVCGMQFRYLKSFKKHRLNHALERLHGKKDRRNLGGTDSQHGGNQDIVTSTNETNNNDVTDLRINIKREQNDAEDEQDNTIDSAGAQFVDTNLTLTNGEPKISSSEGIYSTNKRPRIISLLSEPESSQLHPVATTSINSLINAERIPSDQILGLNPQEASILNFLRVDAAERQRDKRTPSSRFACPFCGKCVRSKENLKLHVRKHTGERPFVCLFCGRAFGGKSDLTRHLRIHTGERPYHCESCGKCFARADYLSKHLTTHIHNAPR